MNLHSNRGAIPVAVYIALAALGLIGTGAVTVKKGFGIFHSEDTQQAKAEAAALANASARARQAEEEASKARADAAAARAKLAAQEQKRHEAVTEDVAGTVMALEQEKDPSLNVQAALALGRSAYRNSDPISEARLQAMRDLVKSLTAENAAIRASAQKQLADKDAEMERERTVIEAGYKAQLDAKNAATAAAEANAKQFAAQRDEAIVKTKIAIDDVKTAGEKAASFARWLFAFVVLVVGLLWVFPIVARAFPGVPWLAKLAKWCAATLAGGLHVLHEGEKRSVAAGLAEAGRAMAAIRREAPQIAATVEGILDRHISDSNKPIVAAAATAAGAPPTS